MTKNQISKRELITLLSDLYGILSEEDQNLMTEQVHVKMYKKNQAIYNEGDRPDQLLCLLSGKAKICKQGVGGKNLLLRAVKPVDYFGYRAYISGTPYITSAIALEHCVIAHFPLRTVLSIMDHNAQLGLFFIRKLGLALGNADMRTVNLTQKHIRARLAEGILLLKDTYGLDEEGCELNIYLSREDMANLCNMTTANAIRTLSQFASEKLVAVDGRKIKILNENELMHISEMG